MLVRDDINYLPWSVLFAALILKTWGKIRRTVFVFLFVFPIFLIILMCLCDAADITITEFFTSLIELLKQSLAEGQNAAEAVKTSSRSVFPPHGL